MLGGIHTDLLVTVLLLFSTQTGTLCGAEDTISLVTLPELRTNSEYVTKCFSDREGNLICDWTKSQRRNAQEEFVVDVLESAPLEIGSNACLEFWYLPPATANGSELRVLMKSSTSLTEIWASPAQPNDSWRQEFVPLTIPEPGTQVVFEAVQALSPEEQIKFKQMGVRKGACGPQCESNNSDFWTDESTRCLCSAGQLLCFPSQCPEGQICGPERSEGVSTTTSSSDGMCTVHRHTDCSTFDGVLFRFMAPCTYVLAKTCSPTDALPVFSVEVVNEQNDNATLPTVQQVTVDAGDVRVSLLRKQTQRVVVNGVWRKLPLSLGNGTINIKSNPAAIVLGTKFGLFVSYDNAGAIQVTLPSTYSDQVCGLCGNFNHHSNDDFQKPDGTSAKDATALAQSWQTGESASSCETISVPHQCDPLEEAEYSSEMYCGGLLSSSGPFASCLSVLGAESYFRGCLVSMCSSDGDPTVLCETMQAYAAICQEAGVSVPAWRNSTSCTLECGVNSHYNSCSDGCPEVCSSQDITGSCGSCEERCECDSGFKLSGGQCVPEEDCGCWYNGQHYHKGETLVDGDCVQKCQCMGNNAMQCTAMQCDSREVCKVKDGVKGCFPFNPTTCSVYGDPHYITFDRWAYDFQGGCSYTLTTTCGEESSVQFTVIGHNTHFPDENFSRSKLEAVTLQVEDLELTLNQSGAALFVDNSQFPLPYYSNGTYGSVTVYMRKNYIVLETTFGLRLLIDGENRLFLQVDERHKYELCGLCGTYSGYQDDDFVTPEGQNVTDAFEFGDSWRILDSNECVANPNNPMLCDKEQNSEAYDECAAIFGDAFIACHEHIHPSTFLNSCVYDYCATNGDRHTLCESLKSYSAACQVAGVKLPNWEIGTACAEPTTTAAPPLTGSPTPDQSVCPLNCNFDENLCGWEQLIQDSFDWTRHSGPTPSELTGPNQDHTTGGGSYMYLEADNVTHGDSARLMSSTCHFSGPLCLNFWYHMQGSASAMALNIYLVQDNKNFKIWSRMNSQGAEWMPGNVEVNISGPFRIIVEGIRGSNDQSDVAIDDISINFGKCSGYDPDLVSGTERPNTTAEVLPPHPVCNLDCSFNSNLCSWNQMVTDVFDWTRQSGSTPTLMTGPSADHSGDGHYLYIEASNVTQGDTARLISSECQDSGPQCLQFWYHMYGSADTMGLHVYLLQDRLAEAVFWERNDRGNMWHLAQLDIQTTGAFQIIFEGRRGSNDQSDVAIDDVTLYRGYCSGLSGDSNTTAPPSVTVPNTTTVKPPLVNITIQPSVTNVTEPSTEETNSVSHDDFWETSYSVPASQPVCSIDCSFDRNLCSWSQMMTDAFDWTWQSGSTSTLMTGPSADHSGDGHYLYIEASSVTQGDTARLISSECQNTGPQCLQFWYHMYGSADTMGLHVYLLQDRLAEAVFWMRNDQGNVWHLAQLDIQTTGAFQIIFEGRRGSTDLSDVAIDDVKLYHGQCSDLSGIVATEATKPDQVTTDLSPSVPMTTHKAPETTAVTATEAPVCQLQCNFERDLCQWTQLLTDAFDWTRQRGPTSTMLTGPSSDHTTGDGYYLYIEANNASYGDTARLISPECHKTGPQCLQFWYHMYGSADTMGLHVYLVQNRMTEAIWWQRNDQGNMWHLAQLDLTTTGAFQIFFEGRRGSNDQSDVAIDDVWLHRGLCADQVKPTSPAPTTTVPLGTEATEVPSVSSSIATSATPTTGQPEIQTTAGSEHPTTEEPEPLTTSSQPSGTNQSEPPTTMTPYPTTGGQLESQTTATTARPPLPSTTQLQPLTTMGPQPPSTFEPESQTSGATIRPQPPSTAQPQPPTTMGPEPPSTAQPQPPTTMGPELPSTAQPQPPTTMGPEPPSTAQPQPPTTMGPDPPITTEQQPQTTIGPQTSDLPTTAQPQPLTTESPEPPTTVQPKPPTTVGPNPSSTTQQQPQTTIGPKPPSTTQPQPDTTVNPDLPTTVQPQPPTSMRPDPSTTVQPESQTTNRPQPPPTTTTNHPTTVPPQQTTTTQAESQTTTYSTVTTQAPSCPKNSHYTSCKSACSPTCIHLNGPPNCNENETCEPGCVCNVGFVQKLRKCVPIQECGCMDWNGNRYQFNEEWYTNHCSQKCECEKEDGRGKIDCDDEDECDGNSVCLQNGNGNYYCQSTGFDECSVDQDSEYKTFDKMKYTFEGEHSYVLVRTKNLPDNIPDVYIEAVNTRASSDDNGSEEDSRGDSEEDDSDEDDKDDSDDDEDESSEQQEEHHRLEELKIRVYNHTVTFKKNRKLIVDGKRTRTPVTPTSGLNIRKHSSRIYLKTDFGLSVEFDGHSTAEIILPRIYKRRVGGLCGNFDGRKHNDRMKPNGSMAHSDEEFGESWRV